MGNDYFKKFDHSTETHTGPGYPFRADSIKAPNIVIVPGGDFWPTIAFEFGYTEPYEVLKKNRSCLRARKGQLAKEP